ncbi:sigma factor, partial [uncultured Oscillibacter sp.]|uniref:sigma factor n=1 Tax=uncultured Oscillibacter sp. TaxID=876091 RepID=UPI0025E2272C
MLTAALLMLANTMLFSLRLNGGGSFPKPLTAEEEHEYLARMEQGDRAARDALIERNLRLVAHVVKKYYCTQSNQEDLLSIGTIGLIKGISTFQPS